MFQLKITVRATVNATLLLIVVGHEEIFKLKDRTDKLPIGELKEDKEYVLSCRCSAN